MTAPLLETALAPDSAPPAAGRLRVRISGRWREYDETLVVLGRLELSRSGNGWHLRDRGVKGGVHLDGCRVESLPLRPGRRTRVIVGARPGHELLFEVLEAPAPPVPTPSPEPAPKRVQAALVADRLVLTADNGRRLLDEVTFALPPGSLTAVIGPSGAGKSTLLRVLTGQVAPDAGHVLWRGRGLHENHEHLRFQIGLVPQEEILHQQLTVERGLGFAAQLRLSPDTPRRVRRERVEQVIGQMGLTRHRRQRIGTQLSGGQRKRVSIATELLTAPPLLFLDEPTSGLDPGLDRAVMGQLRDLADEGRVVVVATHSVLGLDACDTVLVLGRGGRLAYAGPPEGLLEHFGADDHPQLFDRLESGDHPRVRPTLPPTRRAPAINLPPPQVASWAQLSTVVRRNLAVLLSDRLHLALLVLMPLGLAALARVVQGSTGLSLRLTRTPEGALVATEANQRLTILIVAAALMGAAMAIREVVGERAVFRREYAVGLSPGIYLFGKSLVLGAACFLQGVLVTWLALVGLPEQDHGGLHGWGRWEIALAVGLVATVMCLVGLWLSATVRTVEQAMPALVAVTMVQLVMSSALVKLAGRPVLDQLSWLAPSRWGFAASSASADVERAAGGVPGAVRDPLFAHDPGQWAFDLLMLLALGVVATGLGLRAVRRLATRP